MNVFVARRRRVAAMALLALGLALALSGCSDSSSPGVAREDKGSAIVLGDLQPGGQTFLLRRLEQTVPGFAPIQISLIGGNLQVDPDAETVSLEVAIRNDGGEPLFPPAIVWLSELVPVAVTVENADIVPGPPDTIPTNPPPPRSRWGFDYSALLGDAPELAPGETSGAKTWSFHVPGVVAFSFRAQAEFGLVADLARIAGRCFVDLDGDGVPQDGDPPLPGAMIGAAGPEGFMMTAFSDAEGRYAMPVSLPGLYTLRLWPPLFATTPATAVGDTGGFNQVIFTTPNPLRVLLPPGPDGRPASFLGADFGVLYPPGGGFPPAVFTPAPFDSLGGWHYQYIDGWMQGSVLRLRVGFSGCQPNHPFTLYWQPGPEGSPLPFAHLYLVHELQEDCLAYFERELGFDLHPVWVGMGSPQLPIQLRLEDYQGQVHAFALLPPQVSVP